MFDINNLKRNDKLVFDKLTQDSGTIKCKETLYVVFPERYLSVGLATITKTINVFGVIIIVDENNNYALLKITNVIETEPSVIDTVVHAKSDKTYTFFKYEKGGSFASRLECLMDKDNIPKILDEWLSKNGNIPFYLSYSDILEVFTASVVVTGSGIAANPVAVATLLSIIARDDNNDFICASKMTKEQIDNYDITYVGLSNVAKGYKNIMGNLMGNYMAKGMTASLLIDKPNVTDLEKTLKK